MSLLETTRDGAKPLYVQIAEEIANLIMEDKLPRGSNIGGQYELARKYGVSRVTMRQAIKSLERQGLVITHQGKGTYVSSPSVSQELGRLLSLGEIVEAQGLKHEVRIADFRWVLPPERVASFFAPPSETPVLRIKRLHIADDQPIALAVIYVPAHVGLHLTPEELGRFPLYTIMENRLGIHLGRAVQQISASAANEEVASLLRVEVGSPVLLAERSTCSETGAPVEHITFHYHSDCYRFSVNLERASTLPMIVPPFPGQSGPASVPEGGEEAYVAATLQFSKDPGSPKA